MLFPVGEKVGQEGMRETVADTGGTTATARFERHCLNSSNGTCAASASASSPIKNSAEPGGYFNEGEHFLSFKIRNAWGTFNEQPARLVISICFIEAIGMPGHSSRRSSM